MLKQFLKYQWNTGHFMMGFMFLLFTFYDVFLGRTDSARFGLIFSQLYFYDVIRRNHLNLTLVQVTGFPLRELLQLHNISFLFWFNLWYIVSRIPVAIFANPGWGELMYFALRFEILLLVCIVAGNAIANSDFVTYRRTFWQHFMAGLVFTSVFGISSLFVSICWEISHSYLLMLAFLGAMVAIWRLALAKEKHIKFIAWMLKN